MFPAKRSVFALLVLSTLIVSCSETPDSTGGDARKGSDAEYSSKSGTVGKNSSVLPSEAPSSKVIVRKIVVKPNCIGCWKCVRIDPSHFSMDWTIWKAVPIQAAGNDDELRHAANHCPVAAIVIS